MGYQAGLGLVCTDLCSSLKPLLQSGFSGCTSAGAVLLCVYLVFLLEQWTNLKHPSHGDGRSRREQEELRLGTGISSLLPHSGGQSKSDD